MADLKVGTTLGVHGRPKGRHYVRTTKVGTTFGLEALLRADKAADRQTFFGIDAGERELEAGAFAGRHQRERSTMSLGDTHRNRQAEPGALAHFLCREKRLEHAPGQRRRT